MASKNYFKVSSPERVAELRVLADSLKGNDLLALVALSALRYTQDANIDMVTSGDCSPTDIPNTEEGLRVCSSEMICDMINEKDLVDVMIVNDLAPHYVVDFRPVYNVIVKK